MSQINIDYVPRTVRFKVVVETDYVIDTLPGDPHDDDALAEQEMGYLFEQLGDIPGLGTDNLKLTITPL